MRVVAKPKDLQGLEEAINQYWKNVLTPEQCRSTIDRVKKVLPVVVANGGGATGK